MSPSYQKNYFTRITRGDGDFVGAFRQNVIRVIGSYGGEQEPDEYDEKIKEKEEEMVALIAENDSVLQLKNTW